MIYQNIFISGKYFGRICIEEFGKQFTDRDYSLLYVLQEYVTYYLIKDNLKNYLIMNRFDEIIVQLLENKMVPNEKIEEVLIKKGWQAECVWMCIVIIGSSHDKDNDTLIPTSMQLSTLSANIYSLVYDEYIVLILNIAKPSINEHEILGKIVTSLRDGYFKAGISSKFDEFQKLFYYYQQAVIALDIGQRKDPTNWYFHFEDYVLDYLINQCKSGLPPKYICPQGLLNLIEYDKKHNSNYITILKILLETNLNIAETVRRLYMHRSTFIYHFNRITDITKMNLDDPDIRLLLGVIFKIYDRMIE